MQISLALGAVGIFIVFLLIKKVKGIDKRGIQYPISKN